MKYKKIRPKKSKFKDHKILYIFILFLFMGIGYAALTTSLSINGTTNVATNSWNIHFANINIDSGSVEGNPAASIQSGNMSISYGATLAQPGDYYEFTVDVKNEGTLPGEVSIVNLTGNTTSYLSTSFAYTSGFEIKAGDIIRPGQSRKIKIKTWIPDDLDTSLLPASDTPITLTFNLGYVQADDVVLSNPCTYNGELILGAEYVNGQYTYRYMQEKSYNNWINSYINGWGVSLTDKDSTAPVTTKLCSSINGKPIVSMAYMFYQSKASSIDLSSFDTSKVSNMQYMFEYTSNVEKLDLSSFDTSKVTNMQYMFYASSKMKMLDVSSFDTRAAKDKLGYMFYSMDKLSKLDLSNFVVGMSGTRMFSESLIEITTPLYVDKNEIWYLNVMYDEDYNSYQHLSTSPKNHLLKAYPGKKVIKYRLLGGMIEKKGKVLPGDATTYGDLPTPTKEGREFLGWSTSSNGSNIVNSSSNILNYSLYAVWSNPKTRLLTGTNINVKMKKLAGDTSPDSDTINTSIKEIKRASSLPAITLGNDNIISTSDSTIPVYAWFDNGIIYYYSTEEKIFMNLDSSYMFSELRGLESIDISTFDSSEVSYFNYMFYRNIALKELDLSNFETDDVSEFDYMFNNCISLEVLDISNFNFHNGNFNYFFTGDTSLKRLKTPKKATTASGPSYLNDLPVPMMDDEGNVYTVLNGFVPTQTWLEKQE